MSVLQISRAAQTDQIAAVGLRAHGVDVSPRAYRPKGHADLGCALVTRPGVPVTSIENGNEVFMRHADGSYGNCPFVGIGDGSVANGLDPAGVPYEGMYKEVTPCQA